MPTLAALTLVTACGLFQPPSPTPQVSSVQVLQSTTRTQSGNPSVIPNASSVEVQFNVPMNQPSVERSVNLYKGSYDPATNPSSFQKLNLTSMCNGQWRVRNPNAQAVSFQWDVYGKTEKGVGVAIPSGDTFFQSTTGSNTVRLFVNGASQSVKATNPASCSSQLNTLAWVDSRTVRVTPNTALEAGKVYTVTVSTAAKNEAGTQELPVPFSRGFTTPAPSTRETGVLQPGGSFDFPNGSSVLTEPETFSGEPIVVYSEKLTPDQIPGPLPEQVEVIGDYFRIGTVGENITSGKASNTFLVTLPIPTGVDVRNVGIASFLPENDYYTPEQSQYWALSSPGRTGLINGKPFSTPLDLFTSGTVFVLVRFKNLPNTSIQSPTTVQTLQTSSPFSLTCLDIVCPSNEFEIIKSNFESAYLHWTNVMSLSSPESPLVKVVRIAISIKWGQK
jgi:Bacterial Ig-like domain